MTSNTTPIGFINYSKSFRDTAMISHKNKPDIIATVPVMYLVAHSIELSLKAFLLHKGVELHDLKKYKKFGHNLIKLLKKAKEYGLYDIIEINEIEESALNALNNLYFKKELNYIVTGFKQFPIFSALETLSKTLLFKIGCEVGYPENRL